MSFLSGLGKGLSRAFDGTNLAITQAILAGDYQGAAALRARQAELQRQLQQDSEQHDARDRQVIGAKNLGFSGDEIDGMNGPELSEATRQRALARMFGRGAGQGGGEGDGGAMPPSAAASPPAPEGGTPLYAPPPGAPPPGATFAAARLGSPGLPGFGDGATPADGAGRQAVPFAGARWAQLAATGNLPRAGTPGQAAALPKGSLFIDPDASIRRII